MSVRIWRMAIWIEALEGAHFLGRLRRISSRVHALQIGQHEELFERGMIAHIAVESGF